MPNDTVRASDTALPKSRRLFLVAGTAAALAATLKSVAASSEIVVDDEILALEAEVIRLNEVADKIAEERIEPFGEKFYALLKPESGVDEWDLRLGRASAFSQQCGRDAAIEEQTQVDAQADAAFRRMIAIPCKTPAGRAAKVRTFLIHVGRSDWRGDAKELNWPEDMARALLAEFAGMSAEEIANV